MGVTVSETISDTPIAAVRVTANSWNTRPTMPPISRMGKNTATSEIDMDTTVKLTSRAPFMAAVRRSSPFSRWRVTFSSTTIVLSTTKPVETISAISEKLSRLNPDRYMMPKVPSSDRGTQTVGTSVAVKFLRNRNTTRITSTVDRIRVISTSCTALRIDWVVSSNSLTWMAGGRAACSAGISARIWSTVSMTLAPGCLVMGTSTAGRPLAMPILRIFSWPSRTVATSWNRTAEPLR